MDKSDIRFVLDLSLRQISLNSIFRPVLDFKKNLKIGLSAVGEMYIVGAILRNCLTCLYGNLTAEYFDVQPPVLEDYLR